MDRLTDRFFDMVDHWSLLGQWLFFLIVCGIVAALVGSIFKMGVIIFRGWPPPGCSKGFFGMGVDDLPN